MKIKDMFPDERPRERLRTRGAKALSSAELLAVLLGSGIGGKSAMEVAQELVSLCEGRLTLLAAMPLERLMSLKGVGEARALLISAAMELGRRSFEENAILDKKAVTSPKVAYTLMIPHLKGLDHEECWVIYLNRSNFILGKEMIHTGSMEMVLLDTPGGDCTPSKADITQTDRLRAALRAVEITLLDHIVVAEDSFFSFSDDSRTVMG